MGKGKTEDNAGGGKEKSSEIEEGERGREEIEGLMEEREQNDERVRRSSPKKEI